MGLRQPEPKRWWWFCETCRFSARFTSWDQFRHAETRHGGASVAHQPTKEAENADH